MGVFFEGEAVRSGTEAVDEGEDDAKGTNEALLLLLLPLLLERRTGLGFGLTNAPFINGFIADEGDEDRTGSGAENAAEAEEMVRERPG